MKKERIKSMAEVIENLKSVINPIIMDFSLEEWTEIKNHLGDRHSTIQGSAPIIEAMGGNSQIKDLQAKFQCEMFEAIYSYANHLHKANIITKEIGEAEINLNKNKKVIEKIFG